MKKVLFRVRKGYFDQIISGKKNFELRAASGFWRRMLFGVHPPEVAVFICGRYPAHRRIITAISTVKATEIPEMLGRPVSDQGIRDLNLDKELEAIRIDLGEVYEENSKA